MRSRLAQPGGTHVRGRVDVLAGLPAPRDAAGVARCTARFVSTSGTPTPFDASPRRDGARGRKLCRRFSRVRLRPGGVLAIRVPNGAFYRKWARRRGPISRALLAHNNLLTFPYRWGFTPDSLRALLASTGFATHSVVGDVLVPTADAWTRRWAQIEERLMKRPPRGFGGPDANSASWFEVHATASPETA
jgi:hypothetical protein